MKITKALLFFFILYQTQANPIADLTGKVLNKWLDKQPEHNLLVILDILEGKSENSIVENVMKKIPESFSVVRLNATGKASENVGKASGILILTDDYDGVSWRKNRFLKFLPMTTISISLPNRHTSSQKFKNSSSSASGRQQQIFSSFQRNRPLQPTRSW
jgi:hypothetical protein